MHLTPSETSDLTCGSGVVSKERDGGRRHPTIDDHAATSAGSQAPPAAVHLVGNPCELAMLNFSIAEPVGEVSTAVEQGVGSRASLHNKRT